MQSNTLDRLLERRIRRRRGEGHNRKAGRGGNTDQQQHGYAEAHGGAGGQYLSIDAGRADNVRHRLDIHGAEAGRRRVNKMRYTICPHCWMSIPITDRRCVYCGRKQ